MAGEEARVALVFEGAGLGLVDSVVAMMWAFAFVLWCVHDGFMPDYRFILTGWFRRWQSKRCQRNTTCYSSFSRCRGEYSSMSSFHADTIINSSLYSLPFSTTGTKQLNITFLSSTRQLRTSSKWNTFSQITCWPLHQLSLPFSPKLWRATTRSASRISGSNCIQFD